MSASPSNVTRNLAPGTLFYMPAQVILQQGDITELEVDAIVNPANNDLILGGGVSGAVRRVGGDAVQEECNKLAPIPLGEAVVTGAGRLKCKFVIHCAVMPLGLWADARSIRNSVINAFRRADEKGLKTIAFPAIGTGTGNFPAHRSAFIMFDEIGKYLAAAKSQLEKIYIVCLEPKVMKEFEDRYKEFTGQAKPA